MQGIKPPHCTALDKCKSLLAEINIQDVKRQLVQKGMGTYDSTDELVDAMINPPCDEQYFCNFLHILEQFPKYRRCEKALQDEWELIKARQDTRHSTQQQSYQESEGLEVNCPVQETTQSAYMLELPAEVLKYINEFIPSSANTVTEISQIAEDYADRETLLFITKHIIETLQIYCVAFRVWFQQEVMGADTDEAEYQLLMIVRKLKKLKEALSKSPSMHVLKTVVIKELLAHMHTITEVRKTASSFGLTKLWAFKVVMDKLMNLIKKLSDIDDLHYDQALKFLKDFYIEQENGINEEIAKHEKQDPIVGVLAGGAVGCGMGLTLGCVALGAGAACACGGGIVIGSILLGASIGYVGGKLYIFYCKKKGTEEGKALLSYHKKN